MIGPEQIIARAKRAYPAFLQAWLRGESFVPQRIPLGPPSGDYQALRQAVAALHAQSKAQRGYGYSLESEQRNTRNFGIQSLPIYAHITSAEDLLALAEKTSEFAAFTASVQAIRAALPQLEPWLVQHTQQVIAYQQEWPDLLQVCRYFLTHPRPNRYLRELPIPVHTKFIEQHRTIVRQLLDVLLPTEQIVWKESHFERRYGLRYDEPLIRIRLLDPTIQQQLLLSDISTPLSQAATLPLHGYHTLVVENKLPFLTLPLLPNTIAVFGSGFAVEGLIGLPWLISNPIWYWGDLDAHGFQILAQVRTRFPQAQSLLMDEATFTRFQVFAVQGTATTTAVLPTLTADEQALYAYLVRSQQRLEQEHIAYDYAVAVLQAHIQ